VSQLLPTSGHAGGGAGEPTKRIVVGVDGSPGAARALDWAAAEAGRRGATLVVVGAWVGHGSAEADTPPAKEAHRVVGDASARVEETHPEVAVERSVLEGEPAPALLEAARAADLLVVGARGQGGFRGLRIGSVGQHCVTNADCPVAIVRPAEDAPTPPDATPRRIAVGVDGSDASVVALDWAIAEAVRCAATLEIVAAWVFPGTAGYVFTMDVAIPEAAREVVRTALARAAAMAPGIHVRGDVHQDPPAVALEAVSRQADLLVVGSRGLGAFRGLLLGAVSQHVAQHAHCSVVVVRQPGPH
jgi:nucleotide-binding universal stress UspA family protein